MCGIAAIFAYSADAPNVERDELIAIRDHMISRGPDGCGAYVSPDSRLALAHRRLAILDLSDAGAQPMWSADERYAIVFNGEIYNFRALRSALEARGIVFRSGTDTEVLLHLYAQHGAEMVHHLRGMFAFAIWDARERTLFLARDPFGIKPLYYADDGRTIRIASQVKALLQSKHIDTAPESAGHVGFFLWGSVPDPFTLYRGIRALPAGHTLTISRSEHSCGSAFSAQAKSFCAIPQILREAQSALNPQPSTLNPQALLRASLHDTIEQHLVADVPVGVFQSAGLDSSTITAFASANHRDVRTVTLGFDHYRNTPSDEVPLAETVAHHCGANHRTVWISEQDFEQSANPLFEAMDRPSIDGVNTYFVSLAAKRAGLTVALSGLGGDELFGGYPGFREIPRIVGTLAPLRRVPGIGRGLRLISATTLRRFTSPKYAGLLEYGGTYAGAYLLRRGLFMPWELPDLLHPDFVRMGWEALRPLVELNATCRDLSTSHGRVAALELCWYMRHQLLRDADWAGMAHSLEIRVPFVDVDLLRQLAPMLVSAAPPTKLDMARSAPSPGIPAPLLARNKTGFVVPVRDWLMQSFDPLAVRERGLRGWAREVYSRFSDNLALHRVSMRLSRAAQVLQRTGPSNNNAAVSSSRDAESAENLTALVLLSDGFGGFGGIAKFNRDFLSALCSDTKIARVFALPRLMPHEPGVLPSKLVHVTGALGGKRNYMRAVLRTARQLRAAPPSGASAPLIFCGHINLLPAAFLAQRICGGTIHLIIHGIDAWQPTPNRLANLAARRVDGFIAVSNVTKKRFKRWAGLRSDQGLVLPNCVDLSAYSSGPKPASLLERYGVNGRKILMTLGRLASEERYKGFDEVLAILPRLAKTVPNIAYFVVGDGPDRPRLVAKARRMDFEVRDFSETTSADLNSAASELRPLVVFAGRIPDAEKADHYRLADVYVMPSSGEGFGIVYLEALACGIPVIGSKADGSREALREGRLGTLVDPRNPEEIEAAVLHALRRNGEYTPPSSGDAGLGYFSTPNFHRRVHAITSAILGT
jgi:asparagine synthase (glutamine-hydrolysing)